MFMAKMMERIQLVAILFLLMGWMGICEAGTHNLVIVMDGLRPDYVTPELMPNLEAWGQKGVICLNHHSVFPASTRVNSAAISTGAYPGTNGLLGNKVFFPALDSNKGIDTSKRKDLLKIDELTGGHLLTVPSLAEYLNEKGKKFLVMSTGSTGAATLQNPKGVGDGIIQRQFSIPESRWDQIIKETGEPPEDSIPAQAVNHWIVDAYFKYGCMESGPEVVVLWLAEPDNTAHKQGVGAPLTKQALHDLDTEFARILAELESRQLLTQTNILVMSDHGFSTHTGKTNLESLLIDNGLKSTKKSEDVVITGEAIYVKDHDATKIQQIVDLLQRTEWIGAIFTGPKSAGNSQGVIDGTLSMDLAKWTHERSGDILVTENWSDEKNEFGFPGKTGKDGTAGHGTTSPYDIHNTLIAGGPGFKKQFQNSNSTGNVDIASTLCALVGIEPAPSMQGRVMREILAGGPAPCTLETGTKTYRVEVQWNDGTSQGRYALELQESVTDGHTYLDSTRVERN